MTGHVRVSGAWKDVTSAHCNVNGAWKEIKEGYAKNNGTWEQIYSSVPIGPYYDMRNATFTFDTYYEEDWDEETGDAYSYLEFYVRISGATYITGSPKMTSTCVFTLYQSPTRSML